jgi:tetratricopeptide (TPR) repeat protein
MQNKILKTSLIKKTLMILVGVTLLGLSACDSPEEKAVAYYQNAKQLFEEENFEKAGLEFRNALQLDGSIADAWYHLALLEEQAGKIREYAGDLYKTVELDPNHVQAQLRLSKILLFSDRVDEAKERIALVTRLVPEDPNVWSVTSALLLKEEKNAEAIKAAEKALQLENGHVEASLVLAVEAMGQKRNEEALKFVNDSLEIHQENVPLLLIKMRVLEVLEDKEGIEKIFKTLISVNPDNRQFRNALSQFYLNEGNKGKAEAEIRAIAAENPEDENAKLDIIRYLRAVSGPDVARTELQKIIDANPDEFIYQLALSEIEVFAGNTDEAKKILQGIIDTAGVQENGLKARISLAELLLRERNRPQAEILIEEIIAADDLNSQALLMRGALKLDDGKVEDGITDLRSALRGQPDSVQATTLLARAHEMNGAVELAEDRFSAAYKMSNAEPKAALKYAEFLSRRNSQERVEETLTRSLRTNPQHVGLLTALAQTKLIRKDWTGAAKVAEQIRALDGNNVVSDQILGRSYAGQNDIEKSIQSYEKAYENVPNGTNTMVALVRLYVNQGKVEDAEAFLGKIIESSPDNYEARVLRAQLEIMLEKPDEAVAQLKAVIKDNPKAENAYFALFSHQIRVGDKAGAQMTLDQGKSALPGNFAFLMSQAGLYEIQKKPKEAIVIYEELLGLYPNSEVVANNLASLISTVYNDEENLRKAYTYAKRFRSSKVAYFQDTLGWIHYRLGEYELATGLLEQAVEKSPGIGTLHYHLGMSYKAENNKSNAIEELTKAVEISKKQKFPEAEEAMKALEGLKKPS